MNFKPHELDTMRYALKDLKDNLEAVGPCDHSVNICVCGHRAVLIDLNNLFHRITNGQVGRKQYAMPTSHCVDEANAANAQFKKGTING